MCITMLRIYYSNFALSTWCVRVSLRLCDTARSIHASDYPRDTSRIIFRCRFDNATQSLVSWLKICAYYQLHVARKSHNNVKYAGVRRRFGSMWKMRKNKDFHQISARIFRICKNAHSFVEDNASWHNFMQSSITALID